MEINGNNQGTAAIDTGTIDAGTPAITPEVIVPDTGTIDAGTPAITPGSDILDFNNEEVEGPDNGNEEVTEDVVEVQNRVEGLYSKFGDSEKAKATIKKILGDNPDPVLEEKILKNISEEIEYSEQIEKEEQVTKVNDLKTKNFGLSTSKEYSDLKAWVNAQPEAVRKEVAVLTNLSLPKEVIEASVKLINSMRKGRGAGTIPNVPKVAPQTKITTEQAQEQYINFKKVGDEAGIVALRTRALNSSIPKEWIEEILK